MVEPRPHRVECTRLDRVRDRVGVADERGPAELADPLGDLAQGEVVGAGALDELGGGGPATTLGEVGDVRERCVEVVLAEVVRPERAAEQSEVPVEVVVLLEDLTVPPLRRLVRGRDDRAAVDEDLDVVGVAAGLGGAPLDVGVVLLGLLDRPARRVDAFRDQCREVAALLRDTGLEDHRLALG